MMIVLPGNGISRIICEWRSASGGEHEPHQCPSPKSPSQGYPQDQSIHHRQVHHQITEPIALGMAEQKKYFQRSLLLAELVPLSWFYVILSRRVGRLFQVVCFI